MNNRKIFFDDDNDARDSMFQILDTLYKLSKSSLCRVVLTEASRSLGDELFNKTIFDNLLRIYFLIFEEQNKKHAFYYDQRVFKSLNIYSKIFINYFR